MKKTTSKKPRCKKINPECKKSRPACSVISCSSKAAIKSLTFSRHLCKKHFLAFLEKHVKKAIDEFQLVAENERILVACSGGKDSMTTLHILNRLYPSRVDAICIDEGTKGYRETIIPAVERFCVKNKIRLITTSFKKEFGSTLDEILKGAHGRNPCTICGTLRRWVLSKHAKGYNKMATGHNLDDKAQAILMNFFKAQKALLARQGPVSKKQPGFTQRINPLFLCYENDIREYARLIGFEIPKASCPHSPEALRNTARSMLEEIEKKTPEAKLKLVRNYMKLMDALPDFRPEKQICISCGHPSRGLICKACQIASGLKLHKA